MAESFAPVVGDRRPNFCLPRSRHPPNRRHSESSASAIPLDGTLRRIAANKRGLTALNTEKSMIKSNHQQQMDLWKAAPEEKTTLKGPFFGFTLKSSTWVSDSHGLYDYETHNVSAKTYRCLGRNNAYRVVRTGVDVHLMSERSSIQRVCEDKDCATIAKIIALEGGGYRIESVGVNEDRELRQQYWKERGEDPAGSVSGGEDGEDSSGREARSENLQFWLVLRSLRNGSLPLEAGDVIKLGRHGFKLKTVALECHSSKRTEAALRADDKKAVAEKGEGLVSKVLEPDQNSGEDDASSSYQNEDAENVYRHSTDVLLTTANLPRPFEEGGERSLEDDLATSRNRTASVEGEGSPSPASHRHNRHSGSHSSFSGNGTTDDTGGCVSESHNAQISGSSSAGTEPANQHQQLSAKLSNVKCCRICLCEEENPETDPLITPCTCKGSMRWVHLVCLRTWMQGRLNMKGENNSAHCFFWRPLECELCQKSYPTYVKTKVKRERAPDEASASSDVISDDQSNDSDDDPVDRVVKAVMDFAARGDHVSPSRKLSRNWIELFSIPKPQLPFVVLESKHPDAPNGFHFLNLGNRSQLKMGRGHEADVRVTDISVSRLHAVLRYEPSCTALINILKETSTPFGERNDDNGNPVACGYVRTALGHLKPIQDCQKPYVYITDLKSKFGTLLAVNNPIYLYPRMVLSLQVGRTVLTVYVRKPTWSRLLPSCFNLYYKDLIPHFRRKRTAAGQNGEFDGPGGPLHESYDIRLIETHVPMTAANAGFGANISQSEPDSGLGARVDQPSRPTPLGGELVVHAAQDNVQTVNRPLVRPDGNSLGDDRQQTVEAARSLPP